MRNLRILGLVTIVMVSIAGLAAAQERGVLSCVNGTFRNSGCPSESCTGVLLTCPSGKIMSRSQAKVSYLQGVCDDDDDDPNQRCAGKFSFYSEGCGAQIATHGNLSFIRSRMQFQFCLGSNCSGGALSGDVILKGKGTYEIQTEIGEPSMPAIADLSFDNPGFFDFSAGRFRFNSKRHRLKVKRAFGWSRGTAGGCDTAGACGFGGCIVKLD